MFNTEINKILQSIDGNSFVISDTHFNHKGVLKFEPSRLKEMVKKKYVHLTDSEEKMNLQHTEWIIDNWNSVVGENDLIIHLGDLAWRGHQEILPRLNGKKILILGNHDKKGPNTYHHFEYVVRGAHYIFGDMTYIAESTDKLFSSLQMTVDGKEIMFSHYPATQLEHRFKMIKDKVVPQTIINDRIDRLVEMCEEGVIEVNIHGHTHSLCYDTGLDGLELKNCSLEAINFKPIRIKDLL